MWPLRAARGEAPGETKAAGKDRKDPLGREVNRFQSGNHSLEYVTCGAPHLRPLVLLNSLEYPGWAPAAFCQAAEAAGYRTVTVRRPGFGANPPLPDVDGQFALLKEFLASGGLEDSIVVSSGTAGPIGQRLALADLPQISLSVFANCGFNYDQMAEFKPEWYARTLEQALRNTAGARLSLMTLKSSWGIFGRTWVHETILQKSPGDLRFLSDNPELLDEAIETLLARLEVHTFKMEVAASLDDDPVLADDCFRGRPALTVTGEETSDSWKQGVESEARRLGLPPVTHLLSGDALVIYQSAGDFLALVGAHT